MERGRSNVDGCGSSHAQLPIDEIAARMKVGPDEGSCGAGYKLFCRHRPEVASMTQAFNQPLSGNDMPRFGGIATMMRLPHHPSAQGLDACFIGVPMDIGTGNRSGTRFGPRQIR